METVTRSSGWLRPAAALETIFTSAVTIGTGGSAGAEGPIVQIGAAISSGFGRAFDLARPHVPVLIGCGTAAGISAIFNSPIGGVIFTLEVILYDFSIRTFLPIVLASVIANVTTHAIFQQLEPGGYHAIFYVPQAIGSTQELNWPSLPELRRARPDLRRRRRRADAADVPHRRAVPPPAGAPVLRPRSAGWCWACSASLTS